VVVKAVLVDLHQEVMEAMVDLVVVLEQTTALQDLVTLPL
tara:strand:- start:300 stop:419 length:120 start_codon:yes stop_codon:yes gene_type:complete